MLKEGFYWVKLQDSSTIRWEPAEFRGLDYIDPYSRKEAGWIFLGLGSEEFEPDILEIGEEIKP